MKTITALTLAVLLVTPGVASAQMICAKRFAEIHGKNCPAGAVWDDSYHACIVVRG